VDEAPLRLSFCHLWYALLSTLRCDLRVFVQSGRNALVLWPFLNIAVLGGKLKPALLVHNLEVLSERCKLAPRIAVLRPIHKVDMSCCDSAYDLKIDLANCFLDQLLTSGLDFSVTIRVTLARARQGLLSDKQERGDHPRLHSVYSKAR
jgi:hypothetical protein